MNSRFAPLVWPVCFRIRIARGLDRGRNVIPSGTRLRFQLLRNRINPHENLACRRDKRSRKRITKTQRVCEEVPRACVNVRRVSRRFLFRLLHLFVRVSKSNLVEYSTLFSWFFFNFYNFDLIINLIINN